MVRVAVVMHPLTVPDPTALRSCLAHGCRRQGWPSPRRLQTTPQDPGTRMTARAVDQGVDLVVCCGGDGSVRAVAAALAGTGVPLGVVPTGTGNLLARNLNLPLDLETAVEVALTGRDRRVDVGVAGGERFVVMAGVGFDAAMVADAPPGAQGQAGLAGVRAVRRAAPAGPPDGPEAAGGRRHVAFAAGPWRDRRQRRPVAGRHRSAPGRRSGRRPARRRGPRRTRTVGVVAHRWARAVRRSAPELPARAVPGQPVGDARAEPAAARARRGPRGKVGSLVFEVDPAALVVRVPR